MATTRKTAKTASMANKSAARKIGRNAATGMVILKAPHHAEKGGKTVCPQGSYSVKFGAVTIKGDAPATVVISKNVRLGNTALTRAVTKIASPGVVLEEKADVPVFRAAPDNPKVLIRTLNGKVERGQIRSGKFVAAE